MVPGHWQFDDSHDPERFAGEKLCEPRILLRLQPRAFQYGAGSNHQNAAQIAVALFGDRPELLFAASRIFARHQPNPGCQIATGSKDLRIRDGRCNRADSDNPNAKDGLEPLARTGMGDPMTVFLIGASMSGVVLGATNRIIFLLPAALMALVVASVLIVRSDIDLGLTALTATLFCSGYLLGVVMANTRPRLFMGPSSNVGSH